VRFLRSIISGDFLLTCLRIATELVFHSRRVGQLEHLDFVIHGAQARVPVQPVRKKLPSG
jgi:hypothetical protein